jgi:hypothetical protein
VPPLPVLLTVPPLPVPLTVPPLPLPLAAPPLPGLLALPPLPTVVLLAPTTKLSEKRPLQAPRNRLPPRANILTISPAHFVTPGTLQTGRDACQPTKNRPAMKQRNKYLRRLCSNVGGCRTMSSPDLSDVFRCCL